MKKIIILSIAVLTGLIVYKKVFKRKSTQDTSYSQKEEVEALYKI